MRTKDRSCWSSSVPRAGLLRRARSSLRGRRRRARPPTRRRRRRRRRRGRWRSRAAARAKNPVKVAPAELARSAGDIQVVGTVAFHEDHFAVVGPLVAGRISRLAAGVGDKVQRGQVLAEIESADVGQARADLVVGQGALRRGRRQPAPRDRAGREADLVGARARAGARAVGDRAGGRARGDRCGCAPSACRRPTSTEVDEATTRAVASRCARRIDGTVIERKVTLGQAVERATDAFKIADTSHVWVIARPLREGSVRAFTSARRSRSGPTRCPGETFRGRVAFIVPVIDEATRTAKVRLEFANPKRRAARGPAGDGAHPRRSEAARRPRCWPSRAARRAGRGQDGRLRAGRRRLRAAQRADSGPRAATGSRSARGWTPASGSRSTGRSSSRASCCDEPRPHRRARPSGGAAWCWRSGAACSRSALASIRDLSIDAVPDVTNTQVVDPHQRARAVAAGGGAVPDLPDRDGDERHAGRRRDPLDQPHRRLGGDGHLRGRDRRLVRAPDGQRAAQDRRGRHPARLRPPRARPGLDGPRRDLRVLSGRRRSTRRWSCARCSTGSSSIKLRSVPGVVEVNGMGGEAKQYQVVLDPKRLAGYRLSLGDIAEHPRAQQRRVGGGYIEKNGESFVIRARRAVPQHRGDREHRRHLRRRRHAGAGQEPGRACASARRCASAPSPSTARARSSPARS